MNEVEGTDADAVSAPREDTANELETAQKRARTQVGVMVPHLK